MELEYFGEFETTVRFLNYRQAAEALHMSKSALSKHIKLLEEYIGFELYEQNPSLALTPAGRIFFESVVELKTLYRSRLAKCKKFGRAFPRSYLIGVPSIQDEAFVLLQSVLVSLNDDYQKCFSLIPAVSDGVINEILKEKVDAGIFYTTKNHESVKSSYSDVDLEFKLISQEPLMVLTGNSSRISCQDAVRVEDLKDTPILLAITKNGAIRKTVIDSLFEQINYEPIYQTVYVDDMERLFLNDLGNTVHLVTKSVSGDAMFQLLNRTANVFIPISEDIMQSAFYVYKKSNEKVFGKMILEQLDNLIASVRAPSPTAHFSERTTQ